jgi:glycosyltransferase involved in cell wall biosynthesis
MENVSIIIPCYNHAKFLARAIESALAQTHAGCEVIVVNDGSTDSSETVARAYEPRIRVVTQANQGLSAARNTGIRESSAKLVFFLDSDDWLEPTAVQTMYDALRQCSEDFGIVGCTANVVSAEGITLNPPAIATLTEGKEITWSELVLSTRRSRFPCSVLARRDVFDSCGFFDASYHRLGCEDRDMWIRAASIFRIWHIPQRLLNIQLHDANMSSDPSRQLPGMLRCLAKARSNSSGKILPPAFWSRVYSIFHLQASVLWRDYGRNDKALLHMARSVFCAPFPGISESFGLPRYSRAKRLAVCLRDSILHFTKPPRS